MFREPKMVVKESGCSATSCVQNDRTLPPSSATALLQFFAHCHWRSNGYPRSAQHSHTILELRGRCDEP